MSSTESQSEPPAALPKVDGDPAPGAARPTTAVCVECGGEYPFPVELHHDEEECLTERAKRAPDWHGGIDVKSDCRLGPGQILIRRPGAKVWSTFPPGDGAGHSCTAEAPCDARLEEEEDAREAEDTARKEYIDRVFTYHPPTGEQVTQYEEIRRMGRLLADAILRHAPAGPDRGRACDAVREAVMWANAAIATKPPES
ncbi:hypothetical protein [Phycicoccus sp.]|uniref:Acb2/Tad1 domain-containing protein n=1 Tax=Phycicoccus sp. TaxID=1902410 RepID=UPI002C549311|nr:hypothetical protein [Phycicoccus sp.]HMM95303.1 hypothetical protein [Phycicoccus sp.]